MDDCIYYAIWLNNNCSTLVDAYVYNDDIYYITSSEDMGALYQIFLCSQYYINSR